ncbi:MAG TPA: amidohydrolase family protein [Dehalococcoidia bacterium]|nr:amidohydrolase family protein [Dehalococcoidia bacterium]
MADYKIFSADSHVSEPGDLWLQRIDKEFQFRAPRLEQRELNGKMEDVWLYEGFPPHRVGVGLGAAGKTAGVAFREQGKGYADALPGGWDPAERLKDQDIDGVEGEVIHTTLGFRLFWLQDPKLQRACFRTYNDWLSEYTSYSRQRLVGVPLISLYDVGEAVAELRRAQRIGLHGAMIWLSPPASCPPYTSTVYDPFWAAAEEMDMPVVLHTITGGAESRLSQSSYWDENNSLGTIVGPHEAQRSLGQLILSGVLERFPTLKVQSAENGTDWVPWFVGRLKRAARRAGSFPTKLSLTPLEYFHRQVYFSYIDEPEAVEHRDLIGGDHLMFATDYPHTASTWPKSKEIVERDTASMPAEVRRKLVHDNVLKVFDIPAPVLV